MDDLHKELLKEIKEKIDEQLDDEINNFILRNVNRNIDEELLIKELNLKRFEDDIYHKFRSKIPNIKNPVTEDEIWKHISVQDGCEELLTNLSTLPHFSFKTLRELSEIPIIDTEQNYWPELSIKLQNCILNTNFKIFSISLKIHYNLISVPISCRGGYLSLIQAVEKLASGNYIHIGDNNHTNSRLMQTLKIILETQKLVLLNAQYSKNKVLEEIITTLVSTFALQIKCNDKIVPLLDFVGLLDNNALWFKYLCFCPYTKSITFTALEQHPHLIHVSLDTFLIPLKSKNRYHTFNKLCMNFFNHSCNFLMHYFHHKCDTAEYCLTRNSKESLTISGLIELMINTINFIYSTEIRHKLINFLTSLFDNNPSLITATILEVLLQPFQNMFKTDAVKIISSNDHILKIINIAAKFDYKILIYGKIYNKKNRRNIFTNNDTNSYFYAGENYNGNVNIYQLIVDVTALMMRNYINTSENIHEVDMLVINLLECCSNIYNCHPIFLYNVVSQNLILTLKNFYKTLTNFDCTRDVKQKVLNFMKYFLSYFPHIVELLNDDSLITYILNEIFSNNVEDDIYLLICNLIRKLGVNETLRMNTSKIMKIHLQMLWYVNETHEICTIGDSHINIVLNRLFNLWNGIAFDVRIFKMLDYTEKECDVQSITRLHELIEHCVQSAKNDLEVYAGLLLLRVLITNVNIILYLQAKYTIQDRLSKIQRNILHQEVKGHSADECMILRQNILTALSSVGYPSSFNENKVTSVQSTPSTYIHSSRKKFMPTLCEMQKFLQKSKLSPHDHNWIVQAKRVFKRCYLEGYKLPLLAEILHQCPKTINDNKLNLHWPENDCTNCKLRSEEVTGISVIIRYGLQNQLLNPVYKNAEHLSVLIKQSKVYLNLRSTEFEGFDWFIGVIFLICFGNIEKCKQFILNLVRIPIAPLLWYTFGREYGQEILDNFFQHFVVFLAEKTIIYNALKMINLHTPVIIRKWLSHCFFNVLRFEEICNFIAFSILYTPEHMLHYMAAFFIHCKDNICRVTHNPAFENVLNVTNLEDFKLCNYLPLIENTAAKYKHSIKLKI